MLSHRKSLRIFHSGLTSPQDAFEQLQKLFFPKGVIKCLSSVWTGIHGIHFRFKSVLKLCVRW